MITDKLKVTKEIKQLIIEERNNKNITGIELSRAMKKSDAWISSLENGRTKTIILKDLIRIIKTLLDCSEEEAEEYLKNKLNKLSEEKETTEKNSEIVYYDKENNDNNQKSFKKITDNIQLKFNRAFENNSEYAFASAGEFMDNLQFDIGFTLALIRIPFYLLKDTDTSVRQELFDDINEVVKKYLDKYVVKEDDE